jgi:flagellar L-ring protein precursor FlgH
MRTPIGCVLLTFLLLTAPAIARHKEPAKPLSALDQYIRDANLRGQAAGVTTTPGSLWRSGGSLADLACDPRASRLDDLITIVVSDKASAIAKGGSSSARSSTAKHSVSSLFGVTRATGPLSNLTNLSGDTKLEGQGETSRESALTTTLSARVMHVLPNGYLAVEGVKDIMVNSERQVVTVRGVIRPSDLSPANAVTSDRVAQLEVRVNGKGVVGDAVRRPFILYRILMGLLPF